MRNMSPCGFDPRLGTEPKLGENDKVSEVIFNSRTLSESGTGVGRGVGVLLLFGRKMVLKPLPFQVPAKAVNGPRLGGTIGATSSIPGSIGLGGTCPNKKPSGREILALGLVGLLIWSEHPPFSTGRLYVE